VIQKQMTQFYTCNPTQLTISWSRKKIGPSKWAQHKKNASKKSQDAFKHKNNIMILFSSTTSWPLHKGIPNKL
jgi:hypothetical protein